MTNTEKEIPKQTFFSPFNIQSADIDRNILRLTVPIGTTKEDLVKPENYIQIAKANKVIKPKDLIEVLPEDCSFFAVLFVTGRVNDLILTRIVSYTDLGFGEELESVEISWKGPQRKWSAIRKVDNKELKSGFATKEEAYNWLKSY